MQGSALTLKVGIDNINSPAESTSLTLKLENKDRSSSIGGTSLTLKIGINQENPSASLTLRFDREQLNSIINRDTLMLKYGLEPPVSAMDRYEICLRAGNTKFTFGKYEGHTISEVYEMQKGYLYWCIKTPGIIRRHYKLTADIREYINIKSSLEPKTLKIESSV